MSFLYVGQVVTDRIVFSGSATGTPTAQVYVDGVATGSAVNGSGSAATWVFAVTVPSADVGDYVKIEASAVVSGVTQYVEIAKGAIVEIYSLTSANNSLIPQLIDADGEFNNPIVIGDDYTEDVSRQLTWRIEEPDLIFADTEVWFGAKYKGVQALLVEGSIAEVTVGGTDYWDITIELEASDTTDLSEGDYTYSVELQQGTPERIVNVKLGTFRAVRDAVPAP